MKPWLFSKYGQLTTLVNQTATKDSYVDAATNYGTLTYLYGGYGSSRKLSIYVEFDLSVISNTKALIVSAYLDLRRYVAGNNVNLFVKACTSTWEEATIVLANSPSLDGVKYDAHAVGTAGDDWVTWNITNLIQRISNGELTNYGFAIQTDATANLKESFRSKDYSNAAYRPKLTLNYKLRK